ncbi:MAG TPA: alpha/beta hydrolase [Candidatus Deferrimicrobium sp.]|nr:alpha/beta hydrolase [Candidatus Deferrimicrobium sp.]
MPFVQLPHLKVYYDEFVPVASPEKTILPLIFLHGFTLDHRMWGPQTAYFSKQFRVIVPDARGHGLSEAPETGYSRADRVEDVKQLVDALGIERFHLIGLSMGGTTAIGFALKYQERLASLTLVSPGAAGYDAGKKIAHIDQLAREKGIEAARRKWKEIALSWYRQEKPELRELMARMIDEHSGAIWRDRRRGRYPRENDLERVHNITVPTLIVAGEADRIFLPLARLLHQRITDSKLIVCNDVGHMVNLEAPERFNRDLVSFLEAVAKADFGA